MCLIEEREKKKTDFFSLLFNLIYQIEMALFFLSHKFLIGLNRMKRSMLYIFFQQRVETVIIVQQRSIKFATKPMFNQRKGILELFIICVFFGSSFFSSLLFYFLVHIQDCIGYILYTVYIWLCLCLSFIYMVYG